MEEKVADVARDYKTITTAVEEFKQFSLEEFSQVRMLVSSRIFGIAIEGKKTDALVPLADMLNHKRPQQTAWEYSDKRKGFIIESKENLERGDQVYDSYGKKCNSRFFLNYGFIVENNDANEVPIKIVVPESDPLFTAKSKILGCIMSKTIRVSEDLTEQNMVNFFSFLRFAEFQGDPMVLYKYQFQQGPKKKSEDDDYEPAYQGTNIPPISIENERQVLNRIGAQSMFLLKRYATSYEEDLKILETKKDMTFNERNCVLMRSGEKKVQRSKT
ncbi:MAG: SET domain-containing histone-lysine N-methyltransferase [Acidobacteriaceae bacterium]|nr:SET domain-containing histone-lysine N-methyltransferase [Acidobacteriaceae bacterium]